MAAWGGGSFLRTSALALPFAELHDGVGNLIRDYRAVCPGALLRGLVWWGFLVALSFHFLLLSLEPLFVLGLWNGNWRETTLERPPEVGAPRGLLAEILA